MSQLLALYIFGSAGRGDSDSKSDLDLLAIVNENTGKTSEEKIINEVPSEYLTRKPSISWYGASRISEMFSNGELFAWHLFYESRVIFEEKFSLKSLGQPASYQDAAADAQTFHDILTDIPNEINAGSKNYIYECGLIYVCLRAIAMAASYTFNIRPDFTRYSPLNLQSRPCPISRSEYEIAMASRMCGQRGLPLPNVNSDFVLNLVSRLHPWTKRIMIDIGNEYVNNK